MRVPGDEVVFSNIRWRSQGKKKKRIIIILRQKNNLEAIAKTEKEIILAREGAIN
jgi:hypothetical protein